MLSQLFVKYNMSIVIKYRSNLIYYKYEQYFINIKSIIQSSYFL